MKHHISLFCVIFVLAASSMSYAQSPVSAGDEGGFVARYVKAEDAAFEKPNVAEGPWNEVLPRKVVMLPQNITTPSKLRTDLDHVEARIVHNGRWIAVAVSWKDDDRNESTATDVFSDALAVGFPKAGPMATSPFMGTHEAGMEIIHWKAIWQRDVDQGYQEITDLHPNIVADEYVGYRSEGLPNSDPASTAPMKEVMATPEGRAGLPAVAIGNPVSQIDRKYPVEQSVAEGFGTLSTQKQQDARANAVFKDGRWTVVITRPLDTGDPADVKLAERLETGVNFAIWNGGEGDVGGRKSYSMFTPLRIAPKE